METIRDAPLGRIVRTLTGNKYFRYPEEIPGFVIPYDALAVDSAKSAEDKDKEVEGKELQTDASSESPGEQERDYDLEKSQDPALSSEKLEKVKSVKSIDRVTSSDSRQRHEAEQQLAVQRTVSKPIEPTRTQDGKFLVSWYTTDDQENPQNWSQKKKSWVSFQIWIYTFAVYASSAIYVSSEEGVQEHFGVGSFKAALGLALFVIGYGTGPLIFSPLSEIPIFGRNWPYITTFGIFVVIAVPTAVGNVFGGFLFCRFLQGFFGSPCLATGGATMQDIYSMMYVPVAMAFWVSAAFSAPAIGPLLSGFAVMAEGWRWSLWIILWMSAPVFIVFFIAMPETSEANILLRRAQRLRKLTGNDDYVSQSELNQRHLSIGQIARDAFIKPLEINAKDPAILFSSIYSGLMYGIYYSFFEVFVFVYVGIYNFNLGEFGTVFVCICIGAFLAMGVYDMIILKVVIPEIKKNGMGPQEDVLKPALIFVFGPTISLFLFGWTSRSDIHWIVPTIFLTIYPFSVFIVMQSIFAYIPLSYPQYAASLFAGNDLFRSLFAFGFVLFGRPLFVNLGIGKGCSLLGGLSVLGWLGIYYIYYYGARLRAKSKFAVSPDAK